MKTYHAFTLGASPFAGVLEARILHKHKAHGWSALAERVAHLAAEAEAMRPEPDREVFPERLRAAMISGKLLPNSPLLVNAGDPKQRIFACFAVDVLHPLEKALPTFRFIHDGMGGVGYSVSDQQDFPSLIRQIDADTVEHQAGRPRPASNAVTMPLGGRLDDYLELAGTLKVTNMNVALDDGFMANVQHDNASMNQLHRIARSIHATGQPGVIFPDRIARIAAAAEPVMAANVCGEAPLAADESSLLASLNLTAFCHTDDCGTVRFDEAEFQSHVKLAVRFLDGMHDLHCHANEELRSNTQATRKIGVGIMGYAHVLILCGMRYGDEASLAFAERLSQLMMAAATEESERLAALLGPYPAWQAQHGPARRNAGLVAIAGTATIALIAGTSSGVEPLFSHLWDQIVIGTHLRILDPVVSFKLEQQGIDVEQAQRRLAAGESLQEIAGHELSALMPSATQIPGEVHIKVQAAFQKHIDGGITKTINCVHDTSIEQIRDWLQQAHQSGCLGLTIYRAGSLDGQPMAGV
jgi:ribonucleoside-diphosphate reductase alpha chain